MKQVTLKQVEAWVYSHYDMRRRNTIDLGGLDYIITFENGDTYRYEDHGDAWTTTVTITLNGEMQNTTKYKYHNFYYYIQN